MDRPGEPSFDASLPKLCGSLRNIFLQAKDVAWVADEPQVQAWSFVTPGNSTGVVKRWSAQRVAECGTQVGAEVRAAAVLRELLDEPSPLMALVLEQSAYPKGSTITVYPYAGPSADQMLNTRWAHLTPEQREPLCKKLAISGLNVFEILEGVPAEFGGPKLHGDGKLSNWCYNEEGDFFVCIDFGGFCSTSLADWHAVVSTNYLDSYFARPIGAPGASASPVVRVIEDIEEWRRHTTRSLDLYLLALAIVELYLGHLPAAISYDQYYHLEEYLAAVCDYQWADCVELADAPPEMMEFLLWCMDPHPANRPSSAAEALQHEWLAGQVAAVEQAVADAAPAWTETHRRLREALGGCDASSAQSADPDDSSSEGSSCSLADSDDSSSGHLWSDNTSSYGDSSSSTTTSSITSLDCYIYPACPHQHPAAPVNCSSASSSSTEASNCSLADCVVTISPEQPKLRYSISGCGVVCTAPWAASDTAADQVASPGNVLVDASTLLLPPLVRSSHSNADDEEPHALLALLSRHRNANSSQRSSASSGAAAVADRRPQQQRYQPLRQQTSTSNGLVNINQLVLPPMVCSSHSSATVAPLSHPLECRHSRNPCKWALRHLGHSVRCVGSKFSRLVKVPARQR